MYCLKSLDAGFAFIFGWCFWNKRYIVRRQIKNIIVLHIEREKNVGLVRPVTMKTRSFHQKLEFQRYPPKDFCTALYEHKSSEIKLSNFSKTQQKIVLGRSWAKIGLRKTQPNVNSKCEIPSPGQTSIDKTNDCAMKSDRGVDVRGSDLPGHTVHKLTGDRWRAPARRQTQIQFGAAV